MAEIKDIVNILNLSINKNVLEEEFFQLIKSICKKIEFKVILLNFYNQQELDAIKKEIKIGLETENFEYVASQMKLANDYEEVLDLKNKFQIYESQFFLYKDYIYYFNLNTCENDNHICEYLSNLK